MKAFAPEVAAGFLANGWWDGSTWVSRVRNSIDRNPDRVSLIDPPNRTAIAGGVPRRLTWREVDAEADAIALQLLRCGVGSGDVVAVQLPNIVELALIYVAIVRIGAIISPFPIQYREHELVDLAGRAGATAFVTATNILGRLNAAAIQAMQAEIPTIRNVLAFGDAVPAGAVALDGSTVDADGRALLDEHYVAHPVEPNDIATICWTSGTESTPKGVLRSHGGWGAVLCTTIESPGMTADDVLLCTFPMVNAGGVGGMFGPWLSVGCTLVLHHPFALDIFLQQITDHRVTYTVSPPAVLTQLLVAEDLLNTYDLSSLRAIGSGSAPLTPFLIEGWEARGVEVINFFGSNEGLPLVGDRSTIPDPTERSVYFPNFGAAGFDWRVSTAEQTKSRLVDVETGEVISQANRPGELRISGPTIFSGYLGGQGDPFDEHGYYRSGDVFEYPDADCRYLRYVDRAKDLIIRGGVNISPAEIEALVQSHPKVAEVAAVGVPDEVLGERVAVFVVPRQGQHLVLSEIIEHLVTQRVAKFKLPERLDVVAELPRNPVGKVLKRDLRDRLRAEQVATSAAASFAH